MGEGGIVAAVVAEGIDAGGEAERRECGWQVE